MASMDGDGRRYELLIVDATVVDGSGAARFAGAVGVTRGAAGESARLVVLRDPDAIEDAVGRAARLIHAQGRVVAPGFIDLHSHSGLMLVAEPRHEPKVRQGVTTEVIGIDGLSYAPIPDPDVLAELVEMNAGLDGRPDLDYDWSSVASYLDRFDRGMGVNVAMLVGNSALRLATTGWAEVEAGSADMASMRSLLRESMEGGAYGLSSGLDYPPGSYATTGELADLASVAARLGGFYHSHVRYTLGDRFLDPFREAIDIGRRGSSPSHITHFYHRATFPGTPDQMLALVDEARAEGLDVTFDAYPYEWASTRLLITVPPWVQAGGPGPTKERLADRAVRDRIRDELRERGVLYAGAGGIADIRLGAFRAAANLACEGRTLGDVGRERGGDLVDVLCDLLLSEDLGVNQVTPGPNLPGIRRFYQHPVAMVGTDSTFVAAKPSPRTYGSYPRILGQLVRDEALLTLEDAVARMTSMPAARLGLKDRGRIADGFVADLVVFDPATVRANATYDEPRQFPTGIDHVLVNGVPVVDGGTHTGALPGRALRRGRD
ncbi:MAG TPA: amidohydrolase family protein [Candidatus Limnocylindrales bacterium]|nr:amidohydrolase family protein [Candidatus Limnocylindrales bacterium]